MASLEEIANLTEAHSSVKEASVRSSFEHFLNLYGCSRIANTALENDGDMLIYQWGTYDWGFGAHFELSITRQTTLNLEDPDQAADSMRQLSLTFKYSPCAESSLLGAGNKWCGTPASLEEFRQFVTQSAAYLWAAANPPQKVEVSLGRV